jgi:hypothetical protein
MADERFTHTATVRLEGDLLVVTTNQGAKETLADARENVEAILTLAGGTKRPLLVDMRKIASIERDARAYYAGSSSQSAVALLIDSGLSKVIGNFIIALSKATGPMKLFTSRDDAVRWLQGFL